MSTAPRKRRKESELKIAIIRQGLTVTTVAERIGVHRVYLGSVLSKRFPLNDKLARDLAFALKIPKDRIWALWRGEEQG